MRAARSRMEESENEQLRVFMDSLRGSNLNDADFADASVKMQLVEVQAGPEGDALPLEYDPDRIAEYWGRRPVAVTTRITQLMGEWGGGCAAGNGGLVWGDWGERGGRGSGGTCALGALAFVFVVWVSAAEQVLAGANRSWLPVLRDRPHCRPLQALRAAFWGS